MNSRLLQQNRLEPVVEEDIFKFLELPICPSI